MNRADALKVKQPWWFWAVFALVIGFGTAQDTARKLSGSTGWLLVGRWIVIAGAVLTFFFAGWVAVEKFRARDDIEGTN